MRKEPSMSSLPAISDALTEVLNDPATSLARDTGFITGLMFRQKSPEQSEDGTSSAQRKTSQMKRTSLFHSDRGNRLALFLRLARFMNNRRARCRPRVEAFGPPWCFSSWLAHPDRWANLQQKSWHDSTNLPWSHRTSFGLPRQERMQTQFTSQIQLEERQGHDPTPAQKLLWGTP